MLQAKTGLDEFVSEQHADQIATVLAQWSAHLLGSATSVRAIEQSLAPEFSANSLRSIQSHQLRSDSILEIKQNRFGNESQVAAPAFLEQLRARFASYERLLTASFGITAIEVVSGSQLKTRIRYELVGAGRTVHREQSVGNCDIEWEQAPSSEYRVRKWTWLDETQSRSTAPSFIDIAPIAFGNNACYSAQLLHGSDYWRSILDGACGIDIYGHNGVSVGDIDNDGFDDVYVCQPAGLPNRLLRNRGDGAFEDITEQTGLGILENTACALFVDINNDGWQDLIVVRAAGPMLFVNEGQYRFRYNPDAFHFATPPQGTFTGAAVADYDRDGWLDIYFCLYVYYQGAEQYKYPLPYYDAENGPPNFLFRNNRDGTFRDVTSSTGLDKANTRYSFCCQWNDFNGDGWPDLYVVNDFGRKNLYRNNGDGTFTDVAGVSKVEDTGAGMSVCWRDFDNDGAEDLYVADMWSAAGQRVSKDEAFQKNAPEQARAQYRKHAMGNSLFRNEGNGLFNDRSGAAGVSMGRWSWSSDAWDFDHDGFADLYVTNGMVSGPSRDDLNGFFWRQVIAKSPATNKPTQDYEQGWNAINELLRSDGTWSGFERNVLYANNRDGTFADVSGALGLDFLEDGRSFALSDFDHDGRAEMLLKNRNAPQLRMMKNVIKALPASIAFQLRGNKSNRDAIGATIAIETELGKQVQTVRAGSGFLSQHSKELIFGLGASQGPVRASIRWPNGQTQELRDLPPSHRIFLEEGSLSPVMEAFKAVRSHEVPREGVIGDEFPTAEQTWLLAPTAAPEFSLEDVNGKTWSVAALRGKPALISFWVTGSADRELEMFEHSHREWASQGLQLVTVCAGSALDDRRFAGKYSFPIVRASDAVIAVYNILYRYLFDRYRDLTSPTTLLLDDQGQIVKLYVGALSRQQIENDLQQIPRTPGERLSKALPFPGQNYGAQFRRNYLSYGSVFFQRGYFDQAGDAFRLALQDDSASAEALYGLGSVYLQQNKLAEARESFEKVVKLPASYPDTLPSAWNNLGLLSTRAGHMEQAVLDFQQALRINPNHLIALENLGNAYRQLKQWDDAQVTLQRAIEIKPDDPEVNYSLAMVFAQTNDTERAFAYLTRALQFRPDYPEALNNLGILYLRTRRRDDAVSTFERCIRVAPGFDQPYLNLARVYAVEGQAEKAKSLLEELLKVHPGHAQAQSELDQLAH